MAKIVIIGAGSGFGSRLSIDILARTSLADSTIALCDIHEGRLAQVRDYVQRAIDAHGLPGTVVAGTDREELLPDADCVVTAVSIGGPAYWGEPYRSEVEIPLSYGVVQTVADTVGVGGVFRFLRTAPEHLQFARDMERLCPDAIMLNYTNPMCMLTWLHSVGSSIQNVGLCHSVQGTTRKLAAALGVDYDRVSYLVAGINHQAWVLKLRHGKEDQYPRLRAILDTHEDFADDRVRAEMMRQFGYFVTESTPHNSEYLPYFNRTRELRDHYGVASRAPIPMENTRVRDWMKDSGAEQDGDGDVPPLAVSHEYASMIIEARLTGRAIRLQRQRDEPRLDHQSPQPLLCRGAVPGRWRGYPSHLRRPAAGAVRGPEHEQHRGAGAGRAGGAGARPGGRLPRLRPRSADRCRGPAAQDQGDVRRTVGGGGRPPGLLRVATRIAHEPEQSQARRRQFMVSAPKTCYHGSACTIETSSPSNPESAGANHVSAGFALPSTTFSNTSRQACPKRRYSQIPRT